MDPQRLPLKDLSQEALRDLVEQLAEEYRDVLKIRLKDKNNLPEVMEKTGGKIVRRLGSGRDYYDIDTGVVTVIEEVNGGPATRQLITVNNGCRIRQPPSIPEPLPAGIKTAPRIRGLVPMGPFKKTVDGRIVTYFETRNGRTVEYADGKVTRVLEADGVTEVRIAKFRNVKIPSNIHHAEMKIRAFERINGYVAVAEAPTRGYCKLCEKQRRIDFGDKFDERVPSHRQSRGPWRAFLKQLRAKLMAQPTPAARASEFMARKNLVDLARLRKLTEGVMAKGSIPNAKLVRIGRYLKIAGPAMLAFDAATSCAKAADLWQKGQRDAAVDAFTEFGGRTAGALAGAEACGLLFGGLGSIIPGLGTTVGLLAGGIIGGAVGAYLGEAGTAQLVHQMRDWASGKRGPAGAAKPTGSAPTARPQGAKHPAVEELQQNMLQAGYSQAEIDFIGKVVDARIKAGPWGASATPKDIFEQAGSAVFGPEPADGFPASLANYPLAGDAQTHMVTRPAPQYAPPQHAEAPNRKPPAPPAHPAGGQQQHQNAAPAKPGPWTHPPVAPRVTEVVTGVVMTPRSDTRQSSQITAGKQDQQTSDLSSRVDILRQKVRDYDGATAGKLDPSTAMQLEADLGELRRISDELRLRNPSGVELLTVGRNLDEVKNRLEQAQLDVRRAEDQEAIQKRARADDDREKQQQDAQQQRNRDNDAKRTADAERRAADALQKQKDDDDRKQAAADALQKQRDDDDLKRAAADALQKRREDDDRKRAAADALQKQRGDDDRKRAAADALQKQKDDDDRKRATADALQKQRDDDAQKQVSAVLLRKEDEASKQAAASALQKQKDDDARKQAAADALQKQKDYDAWKKAEFDALQRQKDDEKQREAAARIKIKEDEARKQAAANALQQQKNEDARKQAAADALQKQKDYDARQRATADAQQKQKDDDARRQADALQMQKDIEAQKQVAAVLLQKNEQARKQAAADALQRQRDDQARKQAAEALQRQRDDEARKRTADALLQQKANEDRKREADARRWREQEAERLAREKRILEQEQDRQRKAQESDEQQRKLQREREWNALQIQKRNEDMRLQIETQRRLEAEAKRNAQLNRRADKNWDQRRNQDALDRQRQDNYLKQRAEQDRRDKERDLRLRAIEEAKRVQQWNIQQNEARRAEERRRIEQQRQQTQIERERKQREREARQRDYEVQQRIREEQQRQKEWQRQRWAQENEQRQRDRAAKQAERDRQQRDRDARRNQYPQYSTNVSAQLFRPGGNGKRRW